MQGADDRPLANVDLESDPENDFSGRGAEELVIDVAVAGEIVGCGKRTSRQ
jgi:hypothetical protein